MLSCERHVFGGAQCAECRRRTPPRSANTSSAARHQPAHGRAVSPGRIGACHPRAASYVSSDRYAFAPIRAETLADEEYTPESTRGKITHLTQTLPSPSAFGAIDQDKLEVLLRDRAEELGAVTYGLLRS
jgi:hypothetical protein